MDGGWRGMAADHSRGVAASQHHVEHRGITAYLILIICKAIKNMKEALKILLVIIASLMSGAYLHKCQSSRTDIPTNVTDASDTILVIDSIPYFLPTEQAQTRLGMSRYDLPRYHETHERDSLPDNVNDNVRMDSCVGESQPDSVAVMAPIVQKHYRDSNYEAWVSGPIDPQLDSLRVFRPTTIINQKVWKPPKHWHIGITVGYGYGPKGFQPYFGIGATYSIFSF